MFHLPPVGNTHGTQRRSGAQVVPDRTAPALGLESVVRFTRSSRSIRVNVIRAKLRPKHLCTFTLDSIACALTSKRRCSESFVS